MGNHSFGITASLLGEGGVGYYSLRAYIRAFTRKPPFGSGKTLFQIALVCALMITTRKTIQKPFIYGFFYTLTFFAAFWFEMVLVGKVITGFAKECHTRNAPNTTSGILSICPMLSGKPFSNAT